MDTQEIWPDRCSAGYRAQLAPPRNWAVAAAACQMRAGYDIGESGRAIVDNMPVSASGIGAECGQRFPREIDRGRW